MKRALLRLLVLIVGIAIGAAAGGYLTFRTYARDYALVRAFAWVGIFSAVSVNQNDLNESDAKQELLSTLSIYAQGVKSSSIDATMKNAFRMNCGLID